VRVRDECGRRLRRWTAVGSVVLDEGGGCASEGA
jgi:hypothetical protein